MSTIKENIANCTRNVDGPGAVNITLASLMVGMRELEPKYAPTVLFFAFGAPAA